MWLPCDLYRPSLALLTDLYQLTMACGYWRLGLAEREAVFQLTTRRNPFAGGYTVACGTDAAAEWLAALRFERSDLDYLATLKGQRDRPLLDEGFLSWLGDLRVALDVDGLPEGTAFFPDEPVVRVRGPLLQAQLVETALLNLVNFPSLVATKAARVCQAAAGAPVLEFGLRRAQGIDGGLSASRAAYVGGCEATSNVLAGQLLGIPVRGTHAHSWVMSFDDEDAAFRAWARCMPHNAVFLVDTYDTGRGVERAAGAAAAVREAGFPMLGVRLDSGDLAALSRSARRCLDEAGYPEARILASSDLDEHEIGRLRAAGAAIDAYGVGTRLVTGHDQPALGGVYKLAAIRGEDGAWKARIKLSDQPEKTSLPGSVEVRRFARAGQPVLDVLYGEGEPPSPGDRLRMARGGGEAMVPGDAESHDLLVPFVRGGVRVRAAEDLRSIRARAVAEVAALPEAVRRIGSPERYPVALDARLHARRERMIAAARQAALEAT